MRDKVWILIILILSEHLILFSQCPETKLVKIGGQYEGVEYLYFCPAYSFSFDGSNSKKWSILNHNNINKVPKLLEVKARLENKIKIYAGAELFSLFNFYDVDVLYLDSLNKFKDRRPECDLSKCPAKYYFTYYIIPCKGVKYIVGIALDDKENIISKLKFPSVSDFHGIDTTLAVCNVVDIAKQKNLEIKPISEIRFTYDYDTKRFVWTVEQQLKNSKEGLNYYLEIEIDASNRNLVKEKQKEKIIIY